MRTAIAAATTTHVRSVAVTPMPAPSPAIEVLSAPRLTGRRMLHPTVSYSVTCATACTGTTSFRVLVRIGRRHRLVHVSDLDLHARQLSIEMPGASQPVSSTYAGHSLRSLDRLLRAHDAVSFEIVAKAANPAGAVGEAIKSVKLSA